MRALIEKISSGQVLSRSEAIKVAEIILNGETDEVLIAAALIALRTRGETADELAGFLEFLRSRMQTVSCSDKTAVDLCGTGGDGSGSFNLSTAAALVAAAGGVCVAKHGNRAVSSRSGSADFLEALGISIEMNVSDAERSLKERGFAFLFAPRFHGVMKAVAPVRKKLGMRTIFNLLGPLANPAGVKRQMVGVFSPAWMRPVAEALASTGSEHVMAVHGAGGLDEISGEGTTMVCEFVDGEFRERKLLPADLGIEPTNREAIEGGDARFNAMRFRKVVDREDAPLANWIIANAAPAFYLSAKMPSLKAGGDAAREVIQSGRLKEYLTLLTETRTS